MMEDLAFIGQIAVKSSIAVLLATLGEIVAERSGVLNLGVEGMMLVGALCGVAAGVATGNPVIAAAAGALAGAAQDPSAVGVYSASPRASDAAGGQGINVGGGDISAVAPQVGIALVIREDDQDIGTRRGSLDRKAWHNHQEGE